MTRIDLGYGAYIPAMKRKARKPVSIQMLPSVGTPPMNLMVQWMKERLRQRRLATDDPPADEPPTEPVRGKP